MFNLSHARLVALRSLSSYSGSLRASAVVRSAAPQSAESAAVDSARARVRLSYKLPDGLKPYTGSTLLPKAQVDAVRANRTPSSELPASVAASAASEILKRAEREGQEAAMDIRKRLVKPVFEDRAFRGDMGPADLNEQQAQQLFDEIARTPDSPFSHYFLKEFDLELKRRYPDLESAEERYLQFDMEMRARWWHNNALRTGRFAALTQRRVYVNEADLSKHSASHSGKFFEVPADYVASYLTPAPPAAKSYDQQSALRDFAYPLTEFEFAFTRSRRMMIRDDGLVAAALMRRFQQHAFPSLAPAAAPAGLKDVAATPAAAAPAALADEGSIESSLSAMVGQSAAEVEVDADRATMAQAPGDLKAFWAKKLGPKYSVGKDINARLAEVAATDAESLRGSVILLAGMARGGRSTVMHYAVMQARQSNWLVLHMPRFDLACRGGFVLAPSETQSGMYDQPLLAQKMFAELLEQEGEKLKSIKLRGDYSEVKVDELTSKDRHPNYYAHLTPTEEYPFFHVAKGTPATLHDLVAHGAQHRVQACRIVDAFFEELDQVTEFPVLVALDGVNAYDDVTGYVEPTTRTAIPIDRLVFPKSAGRFRLRGPKNGMTLMSHTSTARTDRSGYLFKGNHVRTLNVQPYTVQELRHCVMHYASSGCFNYPIVDRQFVGEISVMTNRLPNEVRKYCELLAVE